MLTVKDTIRFPLTYPLERLGPLETLLFFNIETTGFSGDYSKLYLIGCTYFRDGSWNLIQWFADTADAEKDLLHSFFTFLSNFTTVVHFNGDGFDIPYLLKRCHALGLPYDFSNIKSFDIYKRIRPLKKLLGLNSLKQKSIERFLGIFRQDPYSGGQLIQVYQDYLTTHETVLYDMLMLHNREDLEGMPLILPILCYPDLLESDFTLSSQKLLTHTDLFGDPVTFLQLQVKSDVSIPVPVSWEFPLGSQKCRAELENNRITFEIELYEGECRHFYPDYQNYYYLIYEDQAVHKSVGEFVEKSAKKKATAKTCYTKKQGLFLPQPSELWEPVFKRDYKDKLSFAEYRPALFDDPGFCQSYLSSLLSMS